jgi:hypothetical protein
MVLQILAIGAFVAFFAGAMNGLSKIGTRGISTVAAQWLGIALIASAAFAAGAHTLLLAGGFAAATWLVWKSAPVSGLGSMIGALVASMGAPAHDVLGTRVVATGTVATMLGMAAVVCGVVMSPSKRGVIAVRKVELLVRSATSVVKERGFELRIVEDVKKGFQELGQRKTAKGDNNPSVEAADSPSDEPDEETAVTECDSAQAEDVAEMNPAHTAEAKAPKKQRAARFAGRQKRQKRDDADQAMLERLSETVAPQKAPQPTSEPVASNDTAAADDAAFAEIVKMLKTDS